MSVSHLYCEGVSKGFDIRVLRNVLIGCTTLIDPVGSKHGLMRRTLGARDFNRSVACLRDRDFDFDDDLRFIHSPHPCIINEDDRQIPIGWYWERREIENYLIEPEVVRRVFDLTDRQLQEYKSALEKSAKLIAHYTAARISLSHSRRRILPLDNFWGEEHDDYHSFPKEKALKKEDCYSMILKNIQEYNEDLIISKEKIKYEFDKLCQECNPGGRRFENFLVFFSGKDILYGMRDFLEDFLSLSRTNRLVLIFLERILKRIEETTEDVWTWIPEWKQLRNIVEHYGSDPGRTRSTVILCDD